MSLIALEPLRELNENIADVADMEDGAVGIERLDETAHVGSLEVVRQVDRKLDRGDCGLLGLVIPVADADRVAQILHPDAVDGNTAVVGQTLGIAERGRHGAERMKE